MYGVGPKIVELLSYLRGGEVERVCVGKFDLQFHLQPQGHVSIWACCEVLDAGGNVIDVWKDGIRSAKFCAFVDLLGVIVAEVVVDDTAAMRLVFVDGRQLRLVDTSDQYESFQIGNVIV